LWCGFFFEFANIKFKRFSSGVSLGMGSVADLVARLACAPEGEEDDMADELVQAVQGTRDRGCEHVGAMVDLLGISRMSTSALLSVLDCLQVTDRVGGVMVCQPVL
jgi:hypothetical protein